MTETADIIIKNARVLTMDDASPRAEALGIKGNRILKVGSDAEIASLASAATRIVDAHGATVMPGFVESHMHIFGGSVALTQLSLLGVHGFEALKTAIQAYAAAHPDKFLLIAQSADYNILGERNVTRHDLDAILPDRPFMMQAPDYHTAWANTAALKAAGILEGRAVSVGNEIVMGADGLATGELREAEAIAPVGNLDQGDARSRLGITTGGDPASVTAAERAEDIAVLRKGLKFCAANGITSFHNMDGSLYQLELLDEIDQNGGLDTRVRMPFHAKNFTPIEAIGEVAALWRDRFNTDRLRCDFVKIFADGVTESGTAVYVGGYGDRPEENGDPLFTDEHFNRLTAEIDRHGLQIAVHAIGDGAVRQVLNGYELAQEANGRRDSRHRIEHIETIQPSDIPRFKELGVVASMQPTHPPGGGIMPLEPYLTRVGEARWPLAFAWRTLVDAGAPMVFATDWPVTPIDPLYSIQCAMARPIWKEGLPDQRLTLMETLAAYTKNGAWVEFMEDRKGVLKSGYLADIVMLDGDIEAVPYDKIGTLKPAMTICDGRIIHEAV